MFGLLQFVWGVVDFVRGPLLCSSLFLCGQWVLCACCTTTFAVTSATTVHFTRVMIRAVVPALACPIARTHSFLRHIHMACILQGNSVDVLQPTRGHTIDWELPCNLPNA